MHLPGPRLVCHVLGGEDTEGTSPAEPDLCGRRVCVGKHFAPAELVLARQACRIRPTTGQEVSARRSGAQLRTAQRHGGWTSPTDRTPVR